MWIVIFEKSNLHRFVTKKKIFFKYPFLKIDYLFFINPSLRMVGIIFLKYKNCSNTVTFLFNQLINFPKNFNKNIYMLQITKTLKYTIKSFLSYLNYFLKREVFKISYYKNNMSFFNFEKLFTFLIFNTTLFKKNIKIIIGGTFFLIINFFPLKKIKFNLLYCSIFEKAFLNHYKFDIVFLLIKKQIKFLIFQNLKKKNIFF
uniref:Uncharacterized protein n=1 Tax=Lotharella vacuolata TaxID=74820 RepID=A0A0H5BH57_9EUKA|nr:hypothetical protein [Lotharella vacuolata]